MRIASRAKNYITVWAEKYDSFWDAKYLNYYRRTEQPDGVIWEVHNHWWYELSASKRSYKWLTPEELEYQYKAVLREHKLERIYNENTH